MPASRGGPTALVTGGSSGIGRATALALADRGWTVYAGARRVDRMADLADRGIRVVALDVTDDGQATAVVERIVADTGRIDALVNNAGYGAYGAVEDVDLVDAQAQMDVNVMGLARMTKLVLPHMRARRSGRIVNISSIGGRIVTPLGAWYHASKFAVEGFSRSLRMELEPFGIRVIVVQPGAISTEWGGIARQSAVDASSDGAYGSLVDASTESYGKGYTAASEPEAVARIIVRALSRRHPRHTYPAAGGASVGLAIARVLPERLFDAVLRRVFLGSAAPVQPRPKLATDPEGVVMGNETDPGKTGAADIEVTEKADGVGGDGTIPGSLDGIAAGVTKTASTFEPEEDEDAPTS